ncbi:MAG: hypothetical protein M1834_000072 [Cirrosporium novae-zelandiae]|nr:MAG: hypothetical protein M1834_000072 [Cirrosporium novae-zelandiae]
MAEEVNEKAVPTQNTTTPTTSHDVAAEEAGVAVLPTSWKYRTRKIGPWTLPYYASPQVQLILVAFVCFMCPGMFNAVTGLGGGGQIDATTADNTNVALYSTFAVVGFFAGSIANRLGIKWTIAFGGTGYFLYVASFLCYNHTKNSGFCIFTGAYLGVCAGMLWTAQGQIMTSYPPEGNKGHYIAWFWAIFNVGAVIGALVPLGENIHTTDNSTVSDGTYIGFMVLTFIGALLAFFLTDAQNVVRPDGSRVIIMKNPTWWSEFKGLWETLFTHTYIVLLFPMFFASNWFYTYQFNSVNSAYFDTRTKALNNVLYWTSQIFGAYTFGLCLDIKSLSRTTKAKAAWGALFTVTMVIWGGGYAWQKRYTRADTGADDFVSWDWTHSGYAGPMFLMMFYGFYDAAWQTCIYWFMGALTNNGRRLANFVGFYKGIQSAGAAIIWRLDALKIPYMNEFASCWALLGGSLLIALPVILMKVKDNVDVKEDIKFSDETIEDVQGAEALTAPDPVHTSEKI